MEEEKAKKLIDFLKETMPVFTKYRDLNIILQEESGENFSISSFNELQVFIYHLYSILGSKTLDEIDSELVIAKEQLHGLLYEYYALIQSLLISQISDVVKPYKTETITSVYSNYFHEFLPKIALIKKDIELINKTKNPYTLSSSLDLNVLWGNTQFLIKAKEQLIPLTSEFQQFQSDRKKEKDRERIFQIIIAVVSAIVGAILAVAFAG